MRFYFIILYNNNVSICGFFAQPKYVCIAGYTVRIYAVYRRQFCTVSQNAYRFGKPTFFYLNGKIHHSSVKDLHTVAKMVNAGNPNYVLGYYKLQNA